MSIIIFWRIIYYVDNMIIMDAKHYATEIVKKLNTAGYIAYFAGGWVRDYLMEHPSSDIDIATNAPPEKILDLFSRTLLVGLAFGVVIVLVDGHQFEVSTFRRDISYMNGRKPERIELSTPEEDAYRRDFTINGMFYDPIKDRVYDFVHGKEDIKKGVIRTIGDPQERFLEDRLRMIRAIRFAARFGFTIDPDTQQGIIENSDLLFPAVAMERIWQEFNKMSQYPRFDWALIQMHRLGLLPVIFPALKSIHLTEIKHRVTHFPDFPSKMPTIWSLMDLFPDASLEQLLELCDYLKTSNQDANLVEFAFNSRQFLDRDRTKEKATDVDWTYFYAYPYSQIFLNYKAAHYQLNERELFLQEHKQRCERLGIHIRRLVDRKPLISASLLKSYGIPEGKIMGALLKEAEKIAIMEDLDQPEEVMKKLTRSKIWPNVG